MTRRKSMFKALRSALVAVATLSTVMFAGPAFAGMVSTPKQAAGDVQRDAAKEVLKSRLTEAGLNGASYEEQLNKLSTEDLTMLSTHVQATQNAGAILLVLAIVAGVIIIVAIVVLETFYPWK